MARIPGRGIVSLLIYGTGGHSRVVEDACLAKGQYYDIDFIDDTYESIKTGTWLEIYPKEDWHVFIAIGDNKNRETVTRRVLELGYTIPTIIHPRAYIGSNATINAGVYVGPHAVVQTGAFIFTGAIINTCASVDHDSTVGAFSHIAPGARVCGGVTIGDRCLLGAGSSIIPNVIIRSDTVIGAGAAVIDPLIETGSRMLGVPARDTRTRYSESG